MKKFYYPRWPRMDGDPEVEILEVEGWLEVKSQGVFYPQVLGETIFETREEAERHVVEATEMMAKRREEEAAEYRKRAEQFHRDWARNRGSKLP